MIHLLLAAVVAADPAAAEIVVSASPVANVQPAGSFPVIATALRYDPRTELQSRGIPEGQADIAVRGGVFDNTGIAVGAVTLMDPQTGHYTAELPIDPASLSPPRVLTGIDNALGGFNSNVATIAYRLAPVDASGALALGTGSDALRYQALRIAGTHASASGAGLGAAASVAFSSGDGSRAFGDHDFARYNLHVQRSTEATQSDVVVAWQDKFYGWPGAYTGFANLPETDRTRTSLMLANHRVELDRGWLEIGAYRRRLEDDYDFDRTTQESGVPGAFEHETLVSALGFQGLLRAGRIDWRFGGQLTADELVRSTDLTNGDFDSRRYVKLAVVPSFALYESDDRRVTLRTGATLDRSSRDGGAVSPLAGIALERGAFIVGLDYAVTTQVPGYTALKSGPSGLFGGNPGLGRETARQLALSLQYHAGESRAILTLFRREDADLVDWTYSRTSPFARQANPVDDEVLGIEALLARRWERVELAGGYTWLDKDADFGSAALDASFYALNYARHRATLAATWRWTERVILRLDSEYRVQRDNPLRTNGDEALLASASIAWEPPDGDGFAIALIADNLTDDDYQQFPGTPAVGRQLALNLGYTW
ncbi:MAG TPA: TonB-dependent receptor [Woeseiaceae bacterium]